MSAFCDITATGSFECLCCEARLHQTVSPHFETNVRVCVRVCVQKPERRVQ